MAFSTQEYKLVSAYFSKRAKRAFDKKAMREEETSGRVVVVGGSHRTGV